MKTEQASKYKPSCLSKHICPKTQTITDLACWKSSQHAVLSCLENNLDLNFSCECTLVDDDSNYALTDVIVIFEDPIQ